MILARIRFPSARLTLVDQAWGTRRAAARGLDPATEDFGEDDLSATMDELNGR